MDILLVDDDSYVLQALKKTIDWESIGIRNVYTAQSANKARKIIEDIPIQILICDIEMPKENGFELLKWIKGKQYIITVILLTSYAEFKYATEAIKFGCHAYALKPIDHKKLEDLITDAVKEENRALSLINHEKYYEYWTASLKTRRVQFFQDLLINGQKPDQLGSDLNYQGGQLFLPVMVQYNPRINESGDLELNGSSCVNGQGMFEWTINNLIAEAFATDKTAAEAVLPLKEDGFIAILHMDYNLNRKDFIADLSKAFLKRVNKNLEITCSVIIGVVSRLDHLQREVSDFRSLMQKRLVEYGEVIVLENYDKQAADYHAPDFTVWESFLKCGQDQTVKNEAAKYLDRQNAGNNLDRDTLQRFINHFIQLLISVLKEKGVNTYQMGEALFNAAFIHYSTRNVTNAKYGIGRMIDMVTNMMKRPEEEVPIVQMVRHYIDNNLDKELTRESLADMVYLNQDYLARIFKKETGKSIVHYITDQRIEAAKEFLEKTEEAVNSIAIRIGYDNFSYFTKIFKERVGMTPKDYRRIYGLNESEAAKRNAFSNRP